MRILTLRATLGMQGIGAIFLALFWTSPGMLMGAQKPLSQQQIIGLVEGGVASQRIAHLVHVRGIDFEATPQFLATLKSEGAGQTLLNALKSANQQISPAAEIFAEKNKQAKADIARGKTFLDRKLWTEAEGELRKAIQLDPTDPAAHFYLGHALLAKNDLKGAIAEYQQAISLDPKDEKANYALGVALYHQGDFPQAETQFQRAVELEPEDAEALCALGLTLFRQNHLEGAIREYRQALRLDPQNAAAHAGLAYVLLKKGERRQALEEMRVAASLAPQDLRYRATYQKLWSQLNR